MASANQDSLYYNVDALEFNKKAAAMVSSRL